MLQFSELLDTIQKFLGKELLEHRSYPNLELLRISRARITPLASSLLKSDARLRGIFGVDQNKNYSVNYLFNLDQHKSNLNILVTTNVDKRTTINSIIPEYKMSEDLEKDVFNRLGVDFFLPQALEQESTLCAPFRLAVESSKDNLFQYGIFDNIHRNNNYFEFNFQGNVIQNVQLKTGWMYRGIQELLTKISPFEPKIPVLSRIANLMAVHHQIAYYSGIESLINIKISNKVSIIRTLLAELERIENHIIWFGNLMNLLSFDEKYVELVKLWKKFIEVIKTINGNNIHLSDTIWLGGCIEIPNRVASIALMNIKKSVLPIFDLLYDFVYSSFVEEKCMGLGKISKEDAYKFGFTGPSLRASGNLIDVRHTTPYLSYNSGDVSQNWEVVSLSKGDVYSRVQTRLWEIKNSYNIVEVILKSLESYASSVEPIVLPKEKKVLPTNETAISKVESPHGELIYYFKTDFQKKTANFDAVRIITPDMLNFVGLRHKGLLGEKASGVPNIIHSVDLFFENIDL